MLIRKNDIVTIGPHLLANGDARDSELIKRLVGDKKISLVVNDVPYGSGMVESKEGFIKIRKNKIIANDQLQNEATYRKFTKDWIEAVKPFLARKNSFYIFNSDKMLFALRDGMLDAGVKFAQFLIWIKNQAVMGRLDYLPQHELITYGWFGTHQFNKSQDKSLIYYPRPSKSPLHPTMKPVGLIRRLILNSSKIGEYVYDGFAGSGTAGIACQQTLRKCLMVELDPEYCQTIIERFEKTFGIKAKKL